MVVQPTEHVVEFKAIGFLHWDGNEMDRPDRVVARQFTQDHKPKS